MIKFSLIIPTLNSERVLDECLSHIKKQIYKKDEIEIIIADGGSTDKTIEIAKKYNAIILENPLKTGESGKQVGLRHAIGTYVAFIDSDNILIDEDWLNKMEHPFNDPEIIASEPINFSARKNDHPFTRYFAYLGMGDPINLFLGNYDRMCAITGRWTGMKLVTEKKTGYLKIMLESGKVPTIGANGFVIKRTALISTLNNDYYFDVDVLNFIISSGISDTCYIAKVDTGLVHLFSGNLSTMMRKYRRKVKDYVYYNSVNIRSHSKSNSRNPIVELLYPGGINTIGLLLYIVSCLTILPLIAQAFIGFIRRPDWVWILHPIITEITFYVYATERLKSFFKKSIHDRSNWSQ